MSFFRVEIDFAVVKSAEDYNRNQSSYLQSPVVTYISLHVVWLIVTGSRTRNHLYSFVVTGKSQYCIYTANFSVNSLLTSCLFMLLLQSKISTYRMRKPLQVYIENKWKTLSDLWMPKRIKVKEFWAIFKVSTKTRITSL